MSEKRHKNACKLPSDAPSSEPAGGEPLDVDAEVKSQVDAEDVPPPHPDSLDDSRPTLRTPRLTLRPLYQHDAATIQNLVNDREIARQCHSIDHPYPDGMAQQWIDAHKELWKSGKSAIFGITVGPERDPTQASNGKLIGVVGLEISEQDQNAELGYWLGSAYWNSGYMSEAVAAVIEFGFVELGLQRIYASHLAGNDASGRVMQKCGMLQEGVMRNHIRKWGTFRDAILYGITASDPRPPGNPSLGE